jgi:hypothetical protein
MDRHALVVDEDADDADVAFAGEALPDEGLLQLLEGRAVPGVLGRRA